MSGAMLISSLASSCAVNAERRSGRVLLHESNIGLTFQQASLILFPLFKACGMRRFTFDVFDRIWKMPVDRGEPNGTYGDKLCLGRLL